jgi:hypothetical protein
VSVAQELISGINRGILFEDVSNYTDGQETVLESDSDNKMEELQLWAKNDTAINGWVNIDIRRSSLVEVCAAKFGNYVDRNIGI